MTRYSRTTRCGRGRRECWNVSFFAVAVAVNLSGVATAMLVWITVKLVTSWNRPGQKETIRLRKGAYTALLGSLLSMLFALGGGLICAGFHLPK